MPDYRVIAYIVKTHGRRGEVVAVPVDGLPSLIHTGLSLCVVPPRLKGPRWRKVVAVKPGEHGDQIKLSGIDGLGDSEPLRGRYLLADAKDLPEGFDLHDAQHLLGRRVTDPDLGDLGTIKEIYTGSANDVWVVGAEEHEYTIPVIPSVVATIPPEDPIVVHVSEGTIDTGEQE